MTLEYLIKQREELEAQIAKMVAAAESQESKREPSAEVVARPGI